jgi:hypothetical protein
MVVFQLLDLAVTRTSQDVADPDSGYYLEDSVYVLVALGV